MAKNLNMQMTVTADTSQAKREMKALQDQLSKLGQGLDFGKGFGSGITKEMQQAKTQVAELQVALKNAVNVDTGKLDFTKFNQQLKISGQSLSNYATTLTKLGPEGQQVFLSLAKSVASAEVPLRRVGALTKELGTTLANTVKWQISSSAIHGFMGAIQGAYSYAKELDKSLNNIKIVTGQSADQMARFADYANKTAQELSTTTTEVTDAALIYYQQGLSDEEVKKRTETTLKLANVTRQSAEEVSSQMTAIWNNFAKGSDDLESFADKITALGAATASSSSEISQGLEKFAAVSNTIGLSYDQATAALATVVAQTRQSADVVGTAFKTLFGRLESLKLGDTLEDGVEMKEYSKALETVGVNIFAANGQLKNMDQILDELGARWKTLDKNSQVALAQTVGGMRQYTQLIALMDSYDFFKENVGVAENAEGALQGQQERFATGWEASTKRVKAAWEDLYDTFIDEDFFTVLNDSLAATLKYLSSFIDNLGGLKGVLASAAPILLNMFGDKLQASIQNTVNNIKMMIPGMREMQLAERDRKVEESLTKAKNMFGADSLEYKEFDKEISYRKLMAEYEGKITEEQKDQLDLMHEQEMLALKKQKETEQELQDLEKEVREEQKKTNEIAKQHSYAEDTIEYGTKQASAYANHVALSEMFTPYGGSGESDNAYANIMGERASAALGFINKNPGMVSEDLEKEIRETSEAYNELQKLMEQEGVSEEKLNEARDVVVKKYNELSEKLNNGTYLQDIRSQIVNEIKEDYNLDQEVKGEALKRQGVSILDETFGGQEGYLKTSSVVNLTPELKLHNAKEVIAAKEKYLNTLDMSSKEYKETSEEIVKLKSALERAKKEIDEGNKVIDDQEKAGEKYSTALLDQAEKLGKAQGNQANTQVESKVRTQGMDQAGTSKEDFDKMASLTEQAEAFSNTLVGITQGLTSIGSLYTQISSLGNIWEQHEEGAISFGQALAQTAMSGGMILSSLTSLAASLKKVGESQKFLTLQTLLSNKEKLKSIIITKLQTAEVEANTIAQIKNAKGIQTIILATKAWIAANKDLALSLGLIGIAAILVAAIAKFNDAAAELSRQEAEANKQAQETAQARIEENKAITESLNKFEKMNKMYHDGLSTREEWISSIHDTVEALNDENLKLLEQAEAYELIEEKLKQQSKGATKDSFVASADAIQSSKNQLLNTLKGDFSLSDAILDNPGWIAGMQNKALLSAGSQITDIYGNTVGVNDNEQALMDAVSALGINGINVSAEGIAIDENISKEDYIRFLEFLGEVQKSGEFGNSATNHILEDLEKFSNDISSIAETLREDMDIYNKTIVEGYINSHPSENNGGTLNDLYADQDKYYAEVGELHQDWSEERVKTYVDEVLSQKYSSEILGQNEILRTIADLGGIDQDQFLTDFQTLSEADQQSVLQYGATSSGAGQIAAYYNDAENGFYDFIGRIRNSLEELDSENLATNFSNVMKALNNVEEGKIFETDDAIKNYAKKFGMTKDEFLKEFDGFIEEFDDGSRMFIGNQEDILDQLQKNNEEKLKNTKRNLASNTRDLEQLTGTDVEGYEGWANEQTTKISNLDTFINTRQSEADVTDAQWIGLKNLTEQLENNSEGSTYVLKSQLSSILGDPLPEPLQNIKWYGSGDSAYTYLTQDGIATLKEIQSQILQQSQSTHAAIREATAEKNELQDTYTNAAELYGQIGREQAIVDKGITGNQYITADSTLDQAQDAMAKYGGDTEKYQERIQSLALNTADALDISKDSLIEYAEYLKEVGVVSEDDTDAAYELALANQRLNKGVQDLSDNMDTWSASIEEGKTNSEDYAVAMNGIEASLQNIFNTDDEIDNSFITDNLEDIKKAANGDVEAINKLKVSYAQLQADAASYANGGGATQGLEAIKQAGLEGFDSITTLWDRLYAVPWDNIEIGASMDVDPALQALEKFLVSSKMSATQIQNILDSIGYVADLEYETDEVTGVTYVKSITNAQYTGQVNKPTKKSSKSKSGSSRSKKDKKDYKDEYERYYTINRQIQDQIDEVNRLDKAKSRAWGKAKLQLLDQESDTLAKQIELQKEKIKQVEDYYSYDQKRLNFFGAEYDENGVLTNYDELVKREVDAYNKAVDKYNAGGSESAFNKAENRYKEFQDILKQYDETNQLWYEEMDKLTELQNEYYDMQLEKIQTKVEMDIEVDDSDLKILEYELDRIQKKAFATAEAIAKMSEQLDVNLDKQKVYNDALEEILANHGISSISDINNLSDNAIANLNFTEDEINAIQEYNENLLETQKELDQLEEDILNGPVEAFKEWNEEFDYQEDKIENNINLLKQYKSIADLIYSNSRGVTDQFLYGIMNNTYNNMVSGVSAAYTEWQANKAALAEAMKAYEDTIASGADEQTITLLRNNLREMEDMVKDSENDMLKQTEEALKQAEDLLKQFVDNAAKAVQEAFSATDWDMTKFDRLKTLDDEYLDDYEKIYELSKLTRDVNNSIDDMDTIRAKERLKEITQEIADIEASGKEVSQYEVDALRKKYELRLAEIALEDAQAAKQTVRMSRDNDGNWSYIYTADSDNVDKARQNYEDKLYEYQKLNSEFIKNQEENFLKLEQEYVDAMTKIAEDSSLNEEDKLTRLQETQEYYQRMAEIMTDQLGIALNKNSELYHKDWLDYSKMTDYKISKLEDYQTQIENTYIGYLQPTIESSTQLFSQFVDATVGDGGFFPQIIDGLEEFKLRQDEVLQAAGTSLEDYANNVSTAMAITGASSEEAAQQVEYASEDMRNAFDRIIEKINELNQQNLSSLRSDITSTVNTLQTLVNKYKDVSEAAYEAKKAAQEAAKASLSFNGDPVNGDSSGTSSNGKTSALNGNNSLTISKQEALTKYLTALQSGMKNNPSANASIWGAVTNASSKFTLNSSISINTIKSLTDNEINKIRLAAQRDTGRFNMYKFDTGGYTGSWGAGGRLAMLHQKELVLNAHDTENMLNTIQMVRDIVASIDTRAAAASAMNINAGYAGAIAAGPQDLNQNVHIEASFPNATDHNEIELALTNLVNRASQYVGKKKL